MSKRKPSAENRGSPSKKAKGIEKQTRLDIFFNSAFKTTMPSNMGRPEHSVAMDTNDNETNHNSTSSPYNVIELIDDDEEQPQDVGNNNDISPSTAAQKGKEAVKHEINDKAEETHLSFRALDIDPIIYDPSQQPWMRSGAPYAFLAHALSTLVQTRSRIKIVNILTNTIHTIIQKHPESVLASLYLLSNTLAPPYAPIELGLGPSLISRSIQNVSGITASALKRLYNTLGDPGDVAFSAKSNLRTLIPHPPLTITFVYESLLKIAHAKGQGAAKRKENIVQKLLLSANGEEIRFLTRTLCQNLRVGAVRTSILTALARAMVLFRLSDDAENDFYVTSALLTKAKASLALDKKKDVDTARLKLNEAFTKAEALVKGVFVKHPNFDDITSALLRTGLSNLDTNVPLTIGIPLHPTLGSPMRSLQQVYDKLENQPFVAEFKYDGQRAQIHAIIDNGEVSNFRIFSRHLEDMTVKYPDVEALVQSLAGRMPSVTSFIMDAEIVAIDPRTGELKTFQELSNRARKVVQIQDVQVSVCVYAFDLMYLNGETLLRRTFRERRAMLQNYFLPFIPELQSAARLAHVESVESETGREAVEAFWERALQSQCEGLMIKLLDNILVSSEEAKLDKSRKKPLPATYEPDKRTAAWLKLKKDYVTGIGDSLDLVPIGAWYGNGRKVKWWSPILMGLYNSNSGRIVAVCKCMSGFTDKFYQDLKDRYPLSSEPGSVCSDQPLWECDFGGFSPDVYFRPQEVWEIRGADITLSPVSVAAKGLVSSSRGLSLRFPRFIRIRGDKTVEQASSPEFLASIWRTQQQNNSAGNEIYDGGDDLVDVDLHSSSLESDESDVI